MRKINASGSPVDLQLVDLSLVLVADETGCNANMAKDKVAGANEKVHAVGTRPTIPSASNECISPLLESQHSMERLFALLQSFRRSLLFSWWRGLDATS